MSGWCRPVAVGLVSLLLALNMPAGNIGLSGWVYFSMALLVPLHSRLREQRLRTLTGCE